MLERCLRRPAASTYASRYANPVEQRSHVVTFPLPTPSHAMRHGQSVAAIGPRGQSNPPAPAWRAELDWVVRSMAADCQDVWRGSGVQWWGARAIAAFILASAEVAADPGVETVNPGGWGGHVKDDRLAIQIHRFRAYLAASGQSEGALGRLMRDDVVRAHVQALAASYRRGRAAGESAERLQDAEAIGRLSEALYRCMVLWPLAGAGFAECASAQGVRVIPLQGCSGRLVAAYLCNWEGDLLFAEIPERWRVTESGAANLGGLTRFPAGKASLRDLAVAHVLNDSRYRLKVAVDFAAIGPAALNANRAGGWGGRANAGCGEGVDLLIDAIARCRTSDLDAVAASLSALSEDWCAPDATSRPPRSARV